MGTRLDVLVVDVLIDLVEQLAARTHGRAIEHHQRDGDVLMDTQERLGLLARDGERLVDREPVDARGDERVRHRPRAQALRLGEHAAVAAAQRLALARQPAAPDRPDGVDDPRGIQRERRRAHRASRGTAADRVARRLHVRRARRCKQRAAHAPARLQPRVGGVDDGVGGYPRDVVADDEERHEGPPCGPMDRALVSSELYRTRGALCRAADDTSRPARPLRSGTPAACYAVWYVRGAPRGAVRRPGTPVARYAV